MSDQRISGELVWNGNELVFADAPNVGVAGIAPGLPDTLGQQIADRWNAVEAVARGLCSNNRNHAETHCKEVIARLNRGDDPVTYDDSIPRFPVKVCGIHLRFTCPKCSKENRHGSGGVGHGPPYGHRVSHCACWERGYYLVDSDEPMYIPQADLGANHDSISALQL